MYIVRDPRTVLDAGDARDVEALRLERCDHHFLGSYLIIRARRARTAVERRLGCVAVVRPDPGLEAGDGLDPARGKAVIVEYYSVPDRMPGLLVCGDHVRVVVGALDAPLPRQLIFIDPNWPEPRFEALDRGGLESKAGEFEMMFLDD